MNNSSLCIFCLVLVLGCCAVTQAYALGEKKVAILELNNRAGITSEEAYYLTDLIRGTASISLTGFTIMTRENIFELLPPGTDLDKCTEAKCEVEVGRNIGADYIVTGEIIKFAGDYRIITKAHHSLSGAFLGERTVKGANLKELENSLKQSVSGLFTMINNHAGVSAGRPPTPVGRIGETPGVWDENMTKEAVVRFESDPPGAVVMAGGVLICRATPCSKELPVGSIAISMQRERYLPQESYIEVTRNMKPVVWVLSPNFGWLTVTSQPSGLAVLIDDKNVGSTPVNKREMEPGTYNVLVSDPRYYDQGQRINIQKGEKREVEIVTPPRLGAIKISAADGQDNALEGEVYIDGSKVGTTPDTFKVLIGSHAIKVRSESLVWEDNVEVREKEVETVKATLKYKIETNAGKTEYDGSRRLQYIDGVLQPPGFYKGRSGQEWIRRGKTQMVAGIIGTTLGVGVNIGLIGWGFSEEPVYGVLALYYGTLATGVVFYSWGIPLWVVGSQNVTKGRQLLKETSRLEDELNSIRMSYGYFSEMNHVVLSYSW